MAQRAIGLDQRARDLLLAGVVTLGVLLVTQVIFAGGTPTAVLFEGLLFGATNALIAVGLVLIYRSHRVINFAQAAFGVTGGVFTFNLTTLSDWPYMVSFVAGIVVAAAVGLLFQLVFVFRFFSASRLVLTVLTIAAIPALQAVADFIDQLPVFPPPEDRPQGQLTGRDITLPFEDWRFTVGDLQLPFGFPHVLTLGTVALALAGLVLFFRYTRLGIAIRAAAENADRARVLGISVGLLSMIVWTIAGGLAGLGVILNGGMQGVFSQGVVPPELILVPLAAAVIARFDNMPMAVWAAVVLTVARGAVSFGYGDQLPLFDLALLGAILGAFFLHRRGGRSEETEATSWESTKELRPIPKQMLEVPSVRLTRQIAVGVGGLALLVFPLAARSGQVNLAGFHILVAIAFLSLVVLTGWAGQVSLGQFALVAIAAIVGGALTARVGISFWLAIFLVPFITAAVTVVLGLPALRIRGLFLAVVTFVFAIATQSVLFEERFFGWLLPDAIERPSLFFLDFEDPRSMYYLNLLVLGLSVMLVVTLRRSRPGRILIGLRENENNLRAFGVSPLRMRLTAFALSGFLCGIAGVFLAHHQRAAAAEDFPAQLSLNLFVFAVVGGVGSVAGALMGALYFALTVLIAQNNPIVQFLIGPLGALIILYVAPGGLSSLFTNIRDEVLRIVAQRRQMVVPALYQDVDEDAIRRRLIPLAEPIPNAGLAAIPMDRRYAAASELYGRRGRRREDGERGADEAEAFEAAADRAEEAEEADETAPTTGGGT